MRSETLHSRRRFCFYSGRSFSVCLNIIMAHLRACVIIEYFTSMEITSLIKWKGFDLRYKNQVIQVLSTFEKGDKIPTIFWQSYAVEESEVCTADCVLKLEYKNINCINAIFIFPYEVSNIAFLVLWRDRSPKSWPNLLRGGTRDQLRSKVGGYSGHNIPQILEWGHSRKKFLKSILLLHRR